MGGIAWTNRSWNVVSGCDAVSRGCDNCFAADIAHRFNGGKAFPNGFKVTPRPKRLTAPLRWRGTQLIFTTSMGDPFHEDVTDDFLTDIFAVMAATPRHAHQLLTKRHGRARALLRDPRFRQAVTDRARDRYGAEDVRWPLPNLWLGVSVEDQKTADLRIPALLEIDAAVHFISAEPLLEPIDLRRAVRTMGSERGHGLTGSFVHAGGCCENRLHGLDWVIVGGESGPRARPMDPEWARLLRDECAAAGTALFVKQTGTVLARQFGRRDKGDDLALLPADLRIQEFPITPHTTVTGPRKEGTHR